MDVSVKIDESEVIDDIGQMKLHINVNGVGEELSADDNNISMILQPATQANLTLLGYKYIYFLFFKINFHLFSLHKSEVVLYLLFSFLQIFF